VAVYVLVVEPLPFDEETDAVRAQLAISHRHDLPGGTIVHEAPVADTDYTVCLACTGVGNAQAALIAQGVINWVHPTAVIFVGIAGSLKPDVRVGDVVAATQILAYDGGKQTIRGFKARPRAWDSAHNLLQAAQEAVSTKSWLRFLTDAVTPVPQVHFKPIATGSVVKDAADSPLSELLDASYNNAVAIEMDGGGAALAAHNARVPMLVIRGISDPADGTKAASDASGARPRAAQCAAALALGTIAELPAPNATGRPTLRTGGDAAPSGPQPGTVRWSALDHTPQATWRTDLQRAWGMEPATLEVHLVPVDADARLAVRRLSTLPNELVQLGRAHSLFGQAQAVETDSTASAAIASVREPHTGTNTGLAVLRTGQRIAWEALPKGRMASIFDIDHITERLAALIHVLLKVQVPDPGRVAPTVGLESAMLVTVGKVSDPQPSAVTLTPHQAPVRTDPEDSIEWTDLLREVDQVAQEMAARLAAVFQTQY
jgi:nucleoside phosphorylase